MKLSRFIKVQIAAIVADWEDFARTLPAGRSMTALALRDHGREILLTIASEMDRPQSDQQRTAQAEDIPPPRSRPAPLRQNMARCGRWPASTWCSCSPNSARCVPA